MAPMTLAAFASRVAPKLNPLIWESLRDYMSPGNRDFGWIGQIFNIQATNRLIHEFSNQESAEAWQPGTELSPYPVQEWDLPTDQTFGQIIYKSSFIVSEMQLKYGDPQLHVFPKLADYLQDFSLGAMKAYNRRAGAILLDMFTGALLTCPDGQPLISNTHTKGTNPTVYDNALDLALSAAAIDAAYALNTAEDMQDATGDPLTTNFDTLVIGMRNRRIANELIKNQYKHGATNEENNYDRWSITKIVECPWFNGSLGTQNWWMLIDSGSHWLRGLVTESPNVRIANAAGGPDQLQFYGRSIFNFFYNDFPGVIASTGATATT